MSHFILQIKLLTNQSLDLDVNVQDITLPQCFLKLRLSTSYQRRNEPWIPSWRRCYQTWIQSSCCFVGRWWPQVFLPHRTSHEALSLSSNRRAPPHNHIYTPDDKHDHWWQITLMCRQYDKTIDINAIHNLHHSLRSQTHRTPELYDTEWAPPAATHSSCWVGTLWASRGWWGNHSVWWWTRRRQLLVGQSTNFSGGKTLALHKSQDKINCRNKKRLNLKLQAHV